MPSLASPVIFAVLNRGEPVHDNLTLSLLFQVSPNLHVPSTSGNYTCAFFDTTNKRWNQTGCGPTRYNPAFNRYECDCYHLTSFALIWLPQPPGPPGPGNNSTPPPPRVSLDATDYASMVFQSISIACFIALLIHATITRIHSPQKFTAPRNFLPLISNGVTMITFIMYIAAGMTVYSRYNAMNGKTPNNTSSQGRSVETELLQSRAVNSTSTDELCLRHESNLALTFYFFLILMFTAKANAAYLNFEHYVLYFPPPGPLQLAISFSICITVTLIFVIVASALHANPTNKVMAVVQYKLCWFTQEKVHYFLTLPVSIFCLAIIVLTGFTFNKARQWANKPEQLDPAEHNRRMSHRLRRKRAAVVILVSGLIQAIAWLIGPLISNANPTASVPLQWIFIILNGLEGLWAILLYIIVRKDGLDENVPGQYSRRPDTPVRRWPDTPEPQKYLDNRTSERDRSFDDLRDTSEIELNTCIYKKED